MRWRSPEATAELRGEAWQPKAPFYATALWLLTQWDWKREAPRLELHPELRAHA